MWNYISIIEVVVSFAMKDIPHVNDNNLSFLFSSFTGKRAINDNLYILHYFSMVNCYFSMVNYYFRIQRQYLL